MSVAERWVKMPKDARLYMTFPIDFPDHPKVRPLTDAAFRTFVEMNAYSRRLGLDGVIPVPVAHSMWKKVSLSRLVASHPVKPLVRLVDDNYVMPDYAEHQMTTSDVEALRKKRAEAGARGGKSKAQAKQEGSKPLASAIAKGQQNVAESELGIEITTIDDGDSLTDLALVDARDGSIQDFLAESWLELGVKNAGRVMRVIRAQTAREVSEAECIDVARVILSRSTVMPAYPESYIEKSSAESVQEVLEGKVA